MGVATGANALPLRDELPLLCIKFWDRWPEGFKRLLKGRAVLSFLSRGSWRATEKEEASRCFQPPSSLGAVGTSGHTPGLVPLGETYGSPSSSGGSGLARPATFLLPGG